MLGAEALGTDPYHAAIVWEDVFAGIHASLAYQNLLGSGLVLALGLVGRYLHATWRLHAGYRPDFFAPLLRLVIFCLVLTRYREICQGTVQFVAALGDQVFGEVDVEQLWELRRQAYQKHWQTAHPIDSMDLGGRDALVNAGLELAAHLGLALSQGALVALRTLQVFFLLVLFLAGPWMVALAFWGGPFVNFGWRWLTALIEVSSWSWGLRALGLSLHRVSETTFAREYSISREIAFSFTMASLVVAVPLVMGRLFHGELAGALGSAALQQAQTSGMGQLRSPSRRPT